jgi:hypothetical protein
MKKLEILLVQLCQLTTSYILHVEIIQKKKFEAGIASNKLVRTYKYIAAEQCSQKSHFWKGPGPKRKSKSLGPGLSLGPTSSKGPGPDSFI